MSYLSIYIHLSVNFRVCIVSLASGKLDGYSLYVRETKKIFFESCKVHSWRMF